MNINEKVVIIEVSAGGVVRVICEDTEAPIFLVRRHDGATEDPVVEVDRWHVAQVFNDHMKNDGGC